MVSYTGRRLWKGVPFLHFRIRKGRKICCVSILIKEPLIIYLRCGISVFLVKFNAELSQFTRQAMDFSIIYQHISFKVAGTLIIRKRIDFQSLIMIMMRVSQLIFSICFLL